MAMKACELVFVFVGVHLSKWRSLFRFLVFSVTVIAFSDKYSNNNVSKDRRSNNLVNEKYCGFQRLECDVNTNRLKDKE